LGATSILILVSYNTIKEWTNDNKTNIEKVSERKKWIQKN
jgi:hypothetical protein